MVVTQKPALRGVLHLIAFPIFVAAGIALVTFAGPARPPVAIYAVSIAGLFGVSALYHRGNWAPRARLLLRRLDHSMIFIAIAGSYTALAGLVLPGRLSIPLLVAVWLTAVIGIAIRFTGIQAPKRIAVIPYLLVGWSALAVMPALAGELGLGGLAFLVAGGACYSIGAITFARQRPDPSPAVFGYHEVFHAWVIAGAASHFAVVAFFALPR
ncbi:MAG: hemolysin III family protein [Actinobacteria bacterium]|nr:hemolysin III family protein [Actinomycetota bacterium]